MNPWTMKLEANQETVRQFLQKSPILRLLGVQETADEIRWVFAFLLQTLVFRNGTVQRDGPVAFGVRYHRSFLSQAPDPLEIVTILAPTRIFHPNASPITGALCIGGGYATAGLGLDLILNVTFAGLVFNMKLVNTMNIVNPHAAAYVRDNANLFPLTPKGLFEDPEEDLKAGLWHAPLHAGAAAQARLLMGIEDHSSPSGLEDHGNQPGEEECQ